MRTTRSARSRTRMTIYPPGAILPPTNFKTFSNVSENSIPPIVSASTPSANTEMSLIARTIIWLYSIILLAGLVSHAIREVSETAAPPATQSEMLGASAKSISEP